MDNINLKEARKFLRQEIANLKSQIKTNKTEFRQAQRLVAQFFFQKGYNPYHWWKDNTGKWTRIFKETDEQYDARCKAYEEYLKVSPLKYLPLYDWDSGEKETITCLHVLYNRMRHNKPHTKDDSKYENHYIYKDMLERMAVQFPVLPTATEELGG